jgi:hypothetical protein
VEQEPLADRLEDRPVRLERRAADVGAARRTAPPKSPVWTSSSVEKTRVFIPRRGRSSVDRNIRPTHV